MKIIIKSSSIKKTKLYLVFFCVVISFNTACKQTNKKQAANKVEINDKQSISFENSSNLDDLSVVLITNTDIPVIGDWSTNEENVTFTPVLPFTEGETYGILDKGEIIHQFIVEIKENKPPELVAIYPTTDSVPENLLKMYFVFSNPMQEVGNALDYITVTDNTLKKEVPVFLELQSELWNKDHTVLTLWLDPGRVKTDLIPNQKMGLPINKGHKYTVHINSDWKDATNKPLTKDYSKILLVGDRDTEKPILNAWNITTPKPNTKNPLIIAFKESIDYFLAMECFEIQDASQNTVKGTFSLSDKETKLQFQPELDWKKGGYSIGIESRLEDLAGNNLNHLFDTDLKTNNTTIETGAYKSIKFLVQ